MNINIKLNSKEEVELELYDLKTSLLSSDKNQSSEKKKTEHVGSYSLDRARQYGRELRILPTE